MNEEEVAITFSATFKKAATGVDGGWVLSFDLAESAGNVIADIARLKGVVLQVALVPFTEE